MSALRLPEDFELVLTCTATPEQYDLHDGSGETVAYFRLRWGWFVVTVPDVGGQVVYRRHWEDEPYKGEFADDDERARELQAAIDAVVEWIEADQ